MLVGQDCTVDTINSGTVKISTIHHKLSDIIINQELTTNILAIKHHKKYKVMIKLTFNDDSCVILGKNTYVQIVEEHDIGKIVEAKDVHGGQILCPPLPPYADIRLWGEIYGKPIKLKQTLLYKASTVLFDKCEYVVIDGAPIIHDNSQFDALRKVVKKTNSVGNLIFKHSV